MKNENEPIRTEDYKDVCKKIVEKFYKYIQDDSSTVFFKNNPPHSHVAPETFRPTPSCKNYKD